MAIMITDECINCGACEPECPNNAIYEGGAEWKYSDGTNLAGAITTLDGNEIDAQNAFEILRQLSGNTHKVITGVALKSIDKTSVFTVKTSVSFSELKDEQIRHYIENFHPFDKAGSYGIQDWIGLIGVKKIEGSYTNVMGLPTCELYEAIMEFRTKNIA